MSILHLYFHHNDFFYEFIIYSRALLFLHLGYIIDKYTLSVTTSHGPTDQQQATDTYCSWAIIVPGATTIHGSVDSLCPKRVTAGFGARKLCGCYIELSLWMMTIKSLMSRPYYTMLVRVMAVSEQFRTG